MMYHWTPIAVISLTIFITATILYACLEVVTYLEKRKSRHQGIKQRTQFSLLPSEATNEHDCDV